MTTVKTKSFVVELIQLASQGSCDTSALNIDAFNTAVELMREQEANDVPITEFEEVLPFLKANSCGAEAIFGCPVTEDTGDALAAYLCYSI